MIRSTAILFLTQVLSPVDGNMKRGALSFATPTG